MDRRLVEETLSGDRQAFNRLIELHGPAIYAHVARRIRYPADVEDLVQETFLTGFSQLHRLRERDRFASWLRGIADNLIRMGYRRRYDPSYPATAFPIAGNRLSMKLSSLGLSFSNRSPLRTKMIPRLGILPPIWFPLPAPQNISVGKCEDLGLPSLSRLTHQPWPE